MDSSLLDVSANIIGETPKKKPMFPKSFAKDVVERLAIVTPSGRVDAAEFLSSNTYKNFSTIIPSFSEYNIIISPNKSMLCYF